MRRRFRIRFGSPQLLSCCFPPVRNYIVGTKCCLVEIVNDKMCLLGLASFVTNKVFRTQIHHSCALADTVAWYVRTLRRRFDLRRGVPELLSYAVPRSVESCSRHTVLPTHCWSRHGGLATVCYIEQTRRFVSTYYFSFAVIVVLWCV